MLKTKYYFSIICRCVCRCSQSVDIYKTQQHVTHKKVQGFKVIHDRTLNNLPPVKQLLVEVYRSVVLFLKAPIFMCFLTKQKSSNTWPLP
jgi:hypothetical protein